MRKRLVAVLGAVLGAGNLGAQPPQFPSSPQPPGVYTPGSPAQPQLLPPALRGQTPAPPRPPGAYAPGSPAASLPPQPNSSGDAGAAEVLLPYAEQKTPLNVMDVQVKRAPGTWQVWASQKMLREVGDNETNARDVARVLRDLRPTEWVTIGKGKPVAEYGLTNGRPAMAAGPPDGKSEAKGESGVGQASFNGPIATGAGAKVVLPVDLRTARVEPIRGAWCVRDDGTLLFNFGTDKAGAEQTVAAIRKYGFNRVGVVGTQAQPAMSYLFASMDKEPPKVFGGQLLFNAQVDAMTRTGIPIPGVGFTGEMVKIDPRKVEARKVGFEWVVASGPEVLGNFGATEWAAREAARTVRDANFTEFCKVGGQSNLTFFLRDGKPPTRAPFSAQGRNFDPNGLKVLRINGKWSVTDSGKPLLDVGSPQEGDVIVRVLKAYGFDQMAHLGVGIPKGGITFLVKNR